MASLRNIEKMTEVLHTHHPELKTRPDWLRIDHPADPRKTLDVSGGLREIGDQYPNMLIRREPHMEPVTLDAFLHEVAERVDDAHEQYLNLLLANADPMNYVLGTIPGTDPELLP